MDANKLEKHNNLVVTTHLLDALVVQLQQGLSSGAVTMEEYDEAIAVNAKWKAVVVDKLKHIHS